MGLVRPHLLEWQWSDYSAKHQDRTNLRLHIVAVPLFEIAVVTLIVALATRSGLAVGLALIGMVAAVVIQGRGHRREHEAPTPFAGPIDFVSRFIAEQWITFPRFVLSGGWSRNLTRSSRSQSESNAR
jgi:phage terminase small subunit